MKVMYKIKKIHFKMNNKKIFQKMRKNKILKIGIIQIKNKINLFKNFKIYR